MPEDLKSGTADRIFSILDAIRKDLSFFQGQMSSFNEILKRLDDHEGRIRSCESIAVIYQAERDSRWRMILAAAAVTGILASLATVGTFLLLWKG